MPHARGDEPKKGFDGVNNDDEEYVAFEPTQIKSATDNNGQFAVDDPNVYHQAAGEKQEESLAGKNITGKESIRKEADTPWQDGSIDRAVFDEYLNEGSMQIIREEIYKQISENPSFDREDLPYIKRLRVYHNQLKSKELPNKNYCDRAAVALEYARRCFDNDERIQQDGRIRPVASDNGQGGAYQTDSDYLSGNELGRSGEDGGRSRAVIPEGRGYVEGREDYLNIRNEMYEKKHSKDASAFSFSATAIPNSSSISYCANLNRDVTRAQAKTLAQLAKQYGGEFSEKQMAAFFGGEEKQAQLNRIYFVCPTHVGMNRR